MRYRGQLDDALRAYNNRQVHRIQVPFQYFYDLHEEQSRMLALLNSKISEIERVAEHLGAAQSGKPQAPALRGLREKVFEICRLLLE